MYLLLIKNHKLYSLIDLFNSHVYINVIVIENRYKCIEFQNSPLIFHSLNACMYIKKVRTILIYK